MSEIDTGFTDYYKNSGTGMNQALDFSIIERKFGKYIIKIKLSLEGKFEDIVEIKLNKDFLSIDQAISSKGYHDVEEFYK